ncbi:MAG TPA: chromosomal replication initiator protein DnaA [Phycisphaerae bacterium]|nr:chromosomal replication initiator protein DnaA [Phycisphaerae bacterium]
MNTAAECPWPDVLHYVKKHYPAVNRTWFTELEGGPVENGNYTVVAPDPAQVVYLRRHCIRPFVEAVQFSTGRLIAVDFRASSGRIFPGGLGNIDHGRREDASEFESYPLIPLLPENTFENFVTGPCNRFAHAASLAVGDSPGSSYNPLFIHGACGLGKTHLLQAICHRVLDQLPATRILYVSCETFVNQFIDAVEKNAMNRFRDLYRTVDMLVIDDIQFIAGRDRTQEEFFHTFNALYQVNKQIILSADASPPQIPHLEERLVSRFNWGLIVRVEAPCLETRCAIIRKKMKLRKMELADDAVMYIAQTVASNTRELEGALNRVHGLAALEGRPIDLALARDAMGVEPVAPSRHIRIQDIMTIVTARFDVKLSDLQGRKRSRSIALPRQVCMFLARQFTQHSLEEIGGFFGGRDHTTVLHANKLIAERRRSDAPFRARLEEIENALIKG